MQKSLGVYGAESLQLAKYNTILRLLKQWRSQQQLSSTIYPEVLDSVLLMLLSKLAKGATKPDEFFLVNSCSSILVKVFEELSQIELFQSVLVQKDMPETEIFNYFANVSSLDSLTSMCLEDERRRQEDCSQDLEEDAKKH